MNHKYTVLSDLFDLSLHLNRLIIGADTALARQGLRGSLPKLNLHVDDQLPACVYLSTSNVLSVFSRINKGKTLEELNDTVLNCMAMCGCHRRFNLEYSAWALHQNKLRTREPVLAMYGSPTWQKIRNYL